MLNHQISGVGAGNLVVSFILTVTSLFNQKISNFISFSSFILNCGQLELVLVKGGFIVPVLNVRVLSKDKLTGRSSPRVEEHLLL